MTQSGEFIDPPKPSLAVIVARLAAFGVLLLVAAVAFWAALFIIPMLIVLGLVGYFVARQQLRRGDFIAMRRY